MLQSNKHYRNIGQGNRNLKEWGKILNRVVQLSVTKSTNTLS